MKPDSAYDQLIRRSRELSLLANCIELLGWDELTHMPCGGVANRGRQLAWLLGLHHQLSTDDRFGEMLDVVADSDLVADPESSAAVNVREWQRVYARQKRLPRALIEELASTTTTAQQEWAEARRNSDYPRFAPWLEKIVTLKREEAECLSPNGVPYDALLEEFEPGARSQDLAVLFAALKEELAPLVAAAKPSRRVSAVLRREFPVDRQRIFAEAVASDLGFDFDRGRLDSTPHPFYSVIGPGDCRITTRYSSADFGDAFFAMLHELGHGLYEQGIDPEQYGTPSGEASSMSIHESQSRLWEKFVGQSLPFWRHFYPRARDIFHDTLHGVSLDQFHRAINQVEPGWCRVRADALTYDLHVLIRFELELDLISGRLPPNDLPDAWSDKYQRDLGVTVTSDAQGCLQDSHWAAGQFGYFPTYTLGNLCAAQLFGRIREDCPRLEDEIAAGNFSSLHAWLREHIYRHGQRYPAPDLIARATGEPLHQRSLVTALAQRFAER